MNKTAMKRMGVVAGGAFLLSLTVRSYAADLYWDPNHAATNDFGGSGAWGAASNWYNGSNWTAWAPSNNAIFKGVAGVVALSNVNVAVKLFQVESPGYVFDVKDFTSGRTLSLSNFVGSENMCFTNTVTNVSPTLVFQADSSRVTYKGDLWSLPSGGTGRTTYRLSGGTLEMARTSSYHGEGNNPWYQFFMDSGTLLWNTAYIPIRRLYCGPNSTGGAGNNCILGGNGSNVVVNYDNNFSFWEINPGGALAPGDPAVNNGIGALTLNQYLRFDLSANAGTVSAFRVQFAGPNDCDCVIMSGTNSFAFSPVNFAYAQNSNTVVASRFEPEFFPTFSGGAKGDFICVVDNRVIKSGTGAVNTISGTMANAPHGGTLEITNAAKTVYTLQYLYNVDKDNPDAAGNDFGLRITRIRQTVGGLVLSLF